MSMVRFENVRKSYGDLEVLKSFNLDIEPGEFVVLLGPSGCGKSTLLRSICGLEKVTAGTLYIDGAIVNDVPPADRDIAMVFQSYALYPNLSVFRNIAFPLEMRGVDKTTIKKSVEEVAELLSLSQYLGRLPKQLSGGQRQRVAMGRALVRKPKVFLFDEPLSNLDAALRTQLRSELVNLHRSLGATSIYVTHDQVEAMTMADKIVVLSHGEELQVGTPEELYGQPANTFVAGFIGSPKMNFIRGAEAKKRGVDVLGIRPEHIDVSDEPTAWQGTVVSKEYLGSDTFVEVRMRGGFDLLMRCTADHPVQVQEEVFVDLQENKMLGFSGSEGAESLVPLQSLAGAAATAPA